MSCMIRQSLEKKNDHRFLVSYVLAILSFKKTDLLMSDIMSNDVLMSDILMSTQLKLISMFIRRFLSIALQSFLCTVHKLNKMAALLYSLAHKGV